MNEQHLLFLAIGAVAIAACTTTEAAAPSAPEPTQAAAPTSPGVLPCDVDDVLARRCRQCHTSPPRFGAPMPLVTLDDARSSAAIIGRRIHDDARPMPQPPNPRLDAKDMAVLDGWIAAGGPGGQDGDGTATCAPAGPTSTGPSLSCTPDVHMAPSAAYAMPADSDDRYVCYGFDLPVDAKRHLVAIAPKLDNPGIIHHLVLFQAPSSVASTPSGCDLAQMSKWRLLYGWAPGTGALELPKEAGYPIEGTGHFVVQLHYSNPKRLDGQKDASGFDFCTTKDLRPNDADALVFGDDRFTIPPHGSRTLSCDYTMPAGLPDLHVFAALPHMHQLGTRIHSELVGPGTDLGTRDPWDFGNQIYVPVNATLKPGDVIRTRCEWTNPGDTAVTFGPYTTDEMCYSYSLYYPRISTPGWTWDAPVGKATCTSN